MKRVRAVSLTRKLAVLGVRLAALLILIAAVAAVDRTLLRIVLLLPTLGAAFGVGIAVLNVLAMVRDDRFADSS
jgi:hypothetical protein